MLTIRSLRFSSCEVDAGSDAATIFASTPRFDEKEPLCFILKTSVHLWVCKRRRPTESP